MSLKEYQRKRRFDATPEPSGDHEDDVQATQAGPPLLRFVVQKHAATRLHFDFRLEIDGVFKSWAVPKGPTLDPSEQRLAVEVEDHPLAYGAFEGVIPKGNYGAGTVMIWDAGTFIERSSSGREDSEARLRQGLATGHLTFILSGRKLAGEFALVKIKKDNSADRAWLLIKKRDAHARYQRVAAGSAQVHPTRSAKEAALDRSALTGRSMQEITAEATARGEVWLPGKGPVDPSQLKQDLADVPPPTQGASTPTPKRRSKLAVSPPIPECLRIEDAPRERLPRSLKLMQPTHAADLPQSNEWMISAMRSGVRLLAEVSRQQVRLFSRQRLALDARYPDIVQDLRSRKIDMVVEGEVHDDRFYVWDILHLDGINLRVLPLKVRLEILHQQIPASDRLWPVTYLSGPHASGDLEATEALLVRHENSLYSQGTSKFWLKIGQLQEKGSAAQNAAAAKTPAPRFVFTHLDKVLFPDDGYTKGDLVAYYQDVAAVMLAYLVGRPQSLHRHPHGILAESFFQKDVSGYKPNFVATARVESPSAGRSIDYIVCNNTETLLYMANLGCIEINPWLARANNLDGPTYSVIDLDPDASSNDFDGVIVVALAIKDELDRANLPAFVKTSGSRGLHIYIPLAPGADFERARLLAEIICRRVEARLPQTTMERNPAKRRRRLYLDCMQNRRGQTLAAPYCVRPKKGAPVSAPLTWDELQPGILPAIFNIATMRERLAAHGDLWAHLESTAIDIDEALRQVGASE